MLVVFSVSALAAPLCLLIIVVVVAAPVAAACIFLACMPSLMGLVLGPLFFCPCCSATALLLLCCCCAVALLLLCCCLCCLCRCCWCALLLIYCCVVVVRDGTGPWPRQDLFEMIVAKSDPRIAGAYCALCTYSVYSIPYTSVVLIGL